MSWLKKLFGGQKDSANRIGRSGKLIDDLPNAKFSPRQYHEIFYCVPVVQLKNLLKAFDLFERQVDYFTYGSKEIQIPGTMTLYVSGDKTNTIPMADGTSVLGERYLKHSIFIFKGEDGGIYAFGHNEIGIMFDRYWLETLLGSISRRIEA